MCNCAPGAFAPIPTFPAAVILIASAKVDDPYTALVLEPKTRGPRAEYLIPCVELRLKSMNP